MVPKQQSRQPTASASERGRLLDLALEGKSEEFKARVLEIVYRSRVEIDDPLFLVLVATGRLEVLLEDAPQDWESRFQRWRGLMQAELQAYTLAAQEGQRLAVAFQQAAIARAAATLVKEAERKEAKRFFRSMLPAMGILLGAMGLGVLMGVAIPPWLQGGMDPTGPRQLTLEQAEALRWAFSSEGKFARKLMQWNSGKLSNKFCTKDVNRLGITIEVEGRSATYGFCTIWIEPPENRRFKDK